MALSPYSLKNKSHRLTLFNNKEKKYNLCRSWVSTAGFFLILTIYPKLKGLSYLHFAKGKMEAKEPPSAVPYHAPPSVP